MQNKMPPVHPGEILRGELEGLNISATAFAKSLGVPTNRITEILNEKRRITSDTALRMSRFFGTSAEFWMNLQQAYDLKITREEKWLEIEMSVRPLCVNA
jgi:addiction module HigA family antidote